MPSAELWGQLPVVAIFLLFLAAIAGGAFIFIKWLWRKFDEREEKRQTFEAEQAKLWRQLLSDIELRRDQNDERRDEKLSENMAVLDRHDQQGKRILDVVLRTDATVADIKPRVENIERHLAQPARQTKRSSGT